MCLRFFLVKRDYLSECADSHGISKSSGCVIINRDIDAICTTLKHLNFQMMQKELRNIKTDFNKIACFLGVEGVYWCS